MRRPVLRGLLGMLACSGPAVHAQLVEPRGTLGLRLPPALILAASTEAAAAPAAPRATAPSTTTPLPSTLPSTLPATAPARPTTTPVAGERLSDWLLRQPADPRAYAAGLIWQGFGAT